jgi:hypothetical protein
MSVLPPPPLRWSVGEDGVTVEDLALRTAPAGALLAALSHSPKKLAPAPLDGNVPPPRLCLTPRTSEACLMEGIDPCVVYSFRVALAFFARERMHSGDTTAPHFAASSCICVARSECARDSPTPDRHSAPSSLRPPRTRKGLIYFRGRSNHSRTARRPTSPSRTCG